MGITEGGIAFTDEEWIEVGEDIPKVEDPFLQKYLQGRAALVEEEKKSRSDYSFRQSLSPIAQHACRIVDRIRANEQASTWTPDVEERLAATSHATIFPGMMFSLAKTRMESTRLWRIVRRLPKGALLHAHMDAMVDFDFLLDVLLATPGMHLAASTALATPEARDDAEVQFRFREKSSSIPPEKVWTEDYEARSFVLLKDAADMFPEDGRVGFLRWLKNRLTISQTDSVEHHHGIDAIWQKFAKCFMVVGTIIHYEPIFRAFLKRLMSSLFEDGVNWVELRFTWPLNYCREGREESEADFTHMFEVFEEEIALFRAAHPSFWGMRTIWTTLRSLPTRPIVEDMDFCIATKLAFPHLIAGYDVVGQEDAGRPLRDLLPELFWFRKQCATEGADLPFFFHAGETLGDGSATDLNLFDAVLLGTRRIGHGFSLYKHPLLVDMVKDKRILVESCPISNEVLRLCGSVMAHPLPALLARGVPCALCNDDPAMLGQDTAGMSHDFWQALQGWDNLGLAGLGSLAENSVRWAAFEDQEAAAWVADVKAATLGSGVKAARMKEWAVEWEKFCLWIVTEYGDEFGDEKFEEAS